ncbi:MAG: hypothetical protein ACOVT5_03105 [Armatimonadaceae bacterium]
MKLLRSLDLLLKQPVQSWVQVGYTALLVVCALSLELVGRRATSDVQDSLYALVLLGIVGATALWHRRRPLPWVGWLHAQGTRLLKLLKSARSAHGIDFRGTPPLPPRLPLGVWATGVVSLLALAAGAVGWEYAPGGWRLVGVYTSYVLYLTGVTLVWLVLLGVLMAGLFLPVLLLDRRLTDTFSDNDRRLVVFFTALAYLFVIVAAAAFVPVAVPLVVSLLGVGVAVWWGSRPRLSDIALLWRHSRTRAVHSIPVHRVVAVLTVLLTLGLVAVVVNARAGRLFGPVDVADPMPLTASLAGLVAWVIPGLQVLLGVRVREKQRTNPAARTPMTVFVRNKLSPEAGAAVKAKLAGWGWTVRDGLDAAGPDDVHIQLVHPELSEATEFDPIWPLKITPADLDNPLVKERLERRDEIHLRRRVFKGLSKLLKKGYESRKGKGGGFWLAPHWWFIDGLGREEGDKAKRTEDGEGELLRRVGPPFEKAFGQRPRQYLHKVLRAVQIDVIYIEDGVPLKAVEKVLRQLLEVYDVHAGRRIVDDHTFRGIPKVRVMVHEFSPEKPPTAVTYKQPKFDDLSRGRVLHLFKDKGDHEEVSDVPFDTDYVPSPMLVG